MLFTPWGHRADAIKSSHWLPPFCVCVCVCDGLRGVAKRYMLMGPCVGKADSSFIRLYYTKQYTLTRAHTCTHTHTSYTQHKYITQSKGAESKSPRVSWRMECVYIRHTPWMEQDDGDYYHQSGLRQPVLMTEAESIFYFKGQDGLVLAFSCCIC